MVVVISLVSEMQCLSKQKASSMKRGCHVLILPGPLRNISDGTSITMVISRTGSSKLIIASNNREPLLAIILGHYCQNTETEVRGR